ncbi:FGGY-family carbohydrate kinase [Novosphingobium sp.]|uniref:FGGY-family carbohydrate kinase n=1 Tax=Novosphingobium sp. TaxID=1874826 RepID=UPI003B5274D7
MVRADEIVVVDVGKTLAKVSLWSADGHCLDRHSRANTRVASGGIARLDATGIAGWLEQTLARWHDRPIAAIVPVGHGAAAAAIVDDTLAFAPFDYEAALPEDLLAQYRALRSPFAQTGSPALPQGLNLGAHLFWMDRVHPDAMARATLVPWAQYWAWWLSGVAVSEVTSLGCHTDLWNPVQAGFSDLAVAQGWAGRFAPVVPAAQPIGTLRPDLAARTGLSPDIRVLAGLHDSNAALHAARGFAEIGATGATVLSTGTWFIAMRTGPGPAHLPEARDCLVNVDCFGQPVPSARFMGGREIESLIEIDTRRVDIRPDQPHLIAAVPRVLASGAMHLPTLAPGCGPFPDHAGRWVNPPEDWYERRAAACLYAALVADVALGLVGAGQTLLVEGRFAHAQVFVRAIASLRPDLAVHVAHADTDVSFGALRLVDPALAPPGGLVRVLPLDDDLERYRIAWTAAVTAAQESAA